MRTYWYTVGTCMISKSQRNRYSANVAFI